MGNIKQVILVRSDLNMGPGKIASQVAHASMKVFFDRSEVMVLSKLLGMPGSNFLTVPLNDIEKEWVEGIFTKIVLEVKNEKKLLEAYEKANAAGLPCSLIQDNGLTVFDMVKTYTAVAIGPAASEDIDKITKKFRLMK